MATPTEVTTEMDVAITVAVPVVLAVRVEVRVSSRSNSRAPYTSLPCHLQSCAYTSLQSCACVCATAGLAREAV